MTPRKPFHSLRGLCLAALVLGLLMPHLAVAQDPGQNGTTADGPTTFAQALAAGTTTLAFRARFEGVDQDGFDNEAEATTLRTALTYASGSYRGFRFLIEIAGIFLPCFLILKMGWTPVLFSAGMLIVVPQGHWHRFEAPGGVTLLSATPQPTDHTSAADPRGAP